MKRSLQRLLGFDRYLYYFSIFTINTLPWNRRERDFLHFLKLIPDGGIVLDIGANIGIMSVWLSRKLPGSSIFAFEPMPQNVKTLQRVIRRYRLQNVSIIAKALGSEKKKVEMVMPVLDDVKMQGLSHVMHESIDSFNEGKKFEADMESLDYWFARQSFDKKLEAIKLDVENFEYFVLEGARECLASQRPLIYTELWENENRQKCFDFLEEMQYLTLVLQENQLVEFDVNAHSTQNFFFLPAERKSEVLKA